VATVVTTQPGLVSQWPVDVGSGDPQPSASCLATSAFPGEQSSPLIESVSWDPHHLHTIALGSTGGHVSTLDLRSMKPAASLPGAHGAPVRSLSYNPNRPYVLLSAGDDRALKFWDLRRAGGQPDTPAPPAAPSAEPGSLLLSMSESHAHWVTAAAYNRFHDQLVLSSGTDALTKLWRVAAISSAPPSADALESEEGPGAESESERDGLVRAFEGHDESVYAAVWSAADAWLFATLSLDGRLLVNYVPAAEKYRILL